MAAMFKPGREDRDKNPHLWKRWKALRNIEQQIRHEVEQLTLVGIPCTDLEVCADTMIDSMNLLGARF